MRGAHGVETHRARSEDPAAAIRTTVDKIIRESKTYLKKALEPIDDLLGSAEYKIYITGVLLERALAQAVQERREKAGWKKWLNEPSDMPDAAGDASTSMARTGRAQCRRKRHCWSSSGCGSGLTGTKRSCESQVCGACTVLVDEQPISSCNYLACEAHGKVGADNRGSVARDDVLDPLQEAFMRNIGAQCGFCTPGQIMSAKALLLVIPSPTRQEIAEWLSG